MLLEVALRALDGGDLLCARDDRAHVRLPLRTGNEVDKPLVLRRKQEEGATKERVRTRGKDGDLSVGGPALSIAQRKVNLGTLRATDPVRLHLLYALGPAGELLEVVEQLLSVIGDLEIPLLKIALLGLRPAAPALALGHLLVGKNGLARRAPVDRALLAVNETALPELLENPLTPTVVIGIARLDQAIHVVGEAHALHGCKRLVHVLIGPLGSLRVVLDGGVFRRKAERIEADGMQHVKTAHTGLARHGVADGVVARMPHMQVA